MSFEWDSVEALEREIKNENHGSQFSHNKEVHFVESVYHKFEAESYQSRIAAQFSKYAFETMRFFDCKHILFFSCARSL